MVTLNIVDIDDNAPICTKIPFVAKVRENMMPGQIIAQVNCYFDMTLFFIYKTKFLVGGRSDLGMFKEKKSSTLGIRSQHYSTYKTFTFS